MTSIAAKAAVCLQLLGATHAEPSRIVSDLSQLQLDANGHLASHWLLTSIGCRDQLADIKTTEHLVLRQVAEMTDELATTYLGRYSPCIAVSIERGTPGYQLGHPLPRDLFSGIQNFESWLMDRRKVEIGFVHFYPNQVRVNWVNGNNRVQLAEISMGERHTFWTQSYLGHQFELVNSATEEVVGKYVAEYNAFYSLGDPGVHTQVIPQEEQRLASTFNDEFNRMAEVKRTFTKLGFNKGRLPPDLFASIEAYYYNNQHHLALEEWHNKGGLHVNWYEVPAYMIQMPWELKRVWQTRLKDLVEAWIGGVPLENTDIYGLRQYEEGARLISHVDRINTHAASLIINVAQGTMKEPWYVEIYDHAGRLHEIDMQPGDIVYYESAKCLHGRMKPLNGSHYVNIFSHYRPVGDSQWFEKSNPPGSPVPLMDIGNCVLDRSHCANPSDEHACRARVRCDKEDLPTLSPSLETVVDGKDLMRYWRSFKPAALPVVSHDKDHFSGSKLHPIHSEL